MKQVTFKLAFKNNSISLEFHTDGPVTEKAHSQGRSEISVDV